MTRRTWEERELILLEAIAKAENEGGEDPDSYRLPGVTGLDPREVEIGLRALYDADYITGSDASDWDQTFGLLAIRLLERGRRAVGQWPGDDPYEAFLAVLEQQISGAASGEERSRLERMRDVALSVGRDVLTSVLSGRARQVGGL